MGRLSLIDKLGQRFDLPRTREELGRGHIGSTLGFLRYSTRLLMCVPLSTTRTLGYQSYTA